MRIGKIQKKILLFLLASLAIGLSKSPKQGIKIVKIAKKEWKDIDKAQIKKSVAALENFGVVKVQKSGDGSTEIALTKKGIKIAKEYSLDSLKINKPSKWDKKWRIVIFDVPEKKRKMRDVFRHQLKRLSFYELQHSVWVYPYDCVGEIQYLIDFFDASKYVHLIEATKISDDGFLKKKFNLTKN